MSRYLSKYPLLPQQPIEWLLALTFIISPLFYSENLGGAGFDLPFNISVWAAATLVIAYSVWYLCAQEKLILPANYKGLLALPVSILLAAALAGVHDSITWLFRIMYVMAGVIFLFGLFQFRLKNTDRILLLIVFATLLQSFVGIIQLFHFPVLQHRIPGSEQAIASGIFQQVNVMASFLVTGILVSFYLCLRPIAHKRPYLKAFLLITITAATYVMVATGSRIGLLSGTIGLLMLLIAYRNPIRKNWKTVVAVLLMIVVASWLAKEGLHKTLDKSYRIVEAQYSDQRLSIYRISLNAISEEPIFGHGIGRFVEKWGKASASFAQENPNAKLPQYITHPHNELFLWGIEGGAIALLGIIIALLSVTIFIVRAKYNRLWAYLALLVPITMHTLVELPFYTSSLHWFVWLFLLFTLLNHHCLEKNVVLSSKMRFTIKFSICIFVPLIFLFLFHSYQSQKGINDFARKKSSNVALEHALGNPYFKVKAERLLINAYLSNAIEKDDDQSILQVLSLLNKHIDLRPEPQLFEALAKGYEFLNLNNERCLSINQGLNIFPANVRLLDLYKKCDV